MYITKQFLLDNNFKSIFKYFELIPRERFTLFSILHKCKIENRLDLAIELIKFILNTNSIIQYTKLNLSNSLVLLDSILVEENSNPIRNFKSLTLLENLISNFFVNFGYVTGYGGIYTKRLHSFNGIIKTNTIDAEDAMWIKNTEIYAENILTSLAAIENSTLKGKIDIPILEITNCKLELYPGSRIVSLTIKDENSSQIIGKNYTIGEIFNTKLKKMIK